MSYSNKYDQAEKKRQLLNDKRVADTRNSLAGRQVLDDLLENRGRFAKPKTQTTPLPTYTKASDWCGQDNALEPPFGVDISAVPVCGEPHEQRNVASTTAPDPAPSDASVADVERPGADPIPRRPVHFEED